VAKLDRYIGISVLIAILAVLGIILGLALLFAFIDEVGNVTDTYTVTDVLSYVALTAPRRLYDMMPMAALIGCLIGLGTLASNSELTIMRAAGVSIGRIVWAVMKPMLLLMACSVLIGEYVAPPAEATAQANRALAQGSGEQWQLSDVTTTHFRNVGQGTQSSTEVVNVPTEQWDIALKPELLNTVVMVPEALPISGLWSYIHYLKEQGLNNGRYWLAFWVKVLQPVVTAALVLMAISFIFGPLRSVTLGQRVFTGVLVGFTFRIAQDLLGPSSLVFGFSPLFAVLVPTAICAVAGFWLLRRAG